MPNLLARFAYDLFWLGRYMERAESLARLIDITKTYSGGEPNTESWVRMLRIYGDAERFRELRGEPDTQSVLAFYLLDRDNPTSVAHALQAARDNIRGARHIVSTEMWTHLNIFNNQHRMLTLRDLRLSNVSALCHQIKTGCQAFEGIVEGTLSRGEPWVFYTLGKQIERADQTTRVLDIGYLSLSTGQEDAVMSVQWTTLLRSLAGYQAYRNRYPAGRYAREVVLFLLFDPEFTRSVGVCAGEIEACLLRLRDRLGHALPADMTEKLAALTGELGAEHRRTLSAEKVSDYLDELQMRISDLSDRLAAAYFPDASVPADT